MKKILFLVPVAALLSACSAFNPVGESQFGCPGMPNGVICKTPAAVYNSTNGVIALTDFDTPIEGATPKIAPANNTNTLNTATTTTTEQPLFEAPSVARPLRESAQVMRIWFAPWIDKNDGFNSSSYKFVEVVGRKWSFGRPEAIMGGVIVPHKGEVPPPNVPPVTPPIESKRTTTQMPSVQSQQTFAPVATQPVAVPNQIQTVPSGLPSTTNPFN